MFQLNTTIFYSVILTYWLQVSAVRRHQWLIVTLYADPFEYTSKSYGCYLVILNTTIYTEGSNWYPSSQIRRHGPVINNMYRHQPVFGVHEIKLRTHFLATCTIICDLKKIYILTVLIL